MKHHPLQYLLIPFTFLTYLGTLLILPFYRPVSVRWYAGCLEFVAGRKEYNTDGVKYSHTLIWGRPGGQSWGVRAIWYCNEHARKNESLRIHERVHTLHGEWCNAAGHLLLVPLALLVGLPWWSGVLAGQLTFGALYGGHFLIAWALRGFGPWHDAYMAIWSEKIAYRVEDEWEEGERDGAWGE